jgi:hypothetical protein
MYIYWRISVRLASSGTLQSASARMAERHGRFLTDPRDCHFDPKVLRCTGGNAYLTADEVTTMQKYYDVLALRPCAAGTPFGTCPEQSTSLTKPTPRSVRRVRSSMIVLAAATLWSIVPQAASAGYYCYGYGAVPGSARCAGIGLGLQSPRLYYSDNYPYYIYFYSQNPYYPFRNFVGCYSIRRPVLTPDGWRTHTVQLCD